MSAVIDFIVDVATALWDAFVAEVTAIWDAIVVPILEEIFSWFGIEDETVVSVQRISTPIYDTNVIDVHQAGVARAVMRMVREPSEFFPNYMQELFRVKGQIRAYFRYGELDQYYNGLPEMRLKGTFVDFIAVQAAVDDDLGSTHTILSAVGRHPTEFQWYFEEMQTTHDYQAWTNTLTFTDTYGATRDNWFVDDIVYNSGPDDYSIEISRTMEVAEFYIQGPDQITEGDTATYTVRCNRVVPHGEQITVGFSYAGTAVDGVDFNEIANVVMLQDTDEITVDLVTLETGNAGRTIAITIDSIDNTGGVFEEVNINAIDTVTTTITDDDSLLLTMSDQLVEEANVTITVDVVLNQVAPSGAFDVDYDFTDLGGITGGVDYDNTPGTLNFAGTNGEVQQIMVDIFADMADDDLEQFEIFLENSTDVDGIDISAVAKITILDKTGDPSQDTTVVNDIITKSPAFVKEDSLIVTASDDSAPPGEFFYWIHPHSDMTYDLVPVHQTISDLEMLPLAILRKEKTQLDDLFGPTDPEYLTTKLLMARVGLDINEFLSAIGSNPDIDQVDDCYINFSIAPNDVNPVVSKMLYLAWHQIIVVSGLSTNVDANSATLVEGDIQNAIVWSGHDFTLNKAGTIAATGDYLHTINGTDLTMQFQRVDNFYDEIVMTNLNGITTINYQTYHEVALNVLGDDDFTIPISWDIFSKITAREQMEVFQFICRLDMNAVNISHIDWYKTEAFLDLFEFILIIVLIVITIFTFGAAGGFAGSIYAGFVAVVQQLVISYAIGELIIFLSEKIDSPILIAIIAVAAAILAQQPELLSDVLLLEAEALTTLATEFVDNLIDVAQIYVSETFKDKVEELNALSEEIAATAERIEEEKKNRPDISAVTLNDQFIAALQSVDTNNITAIQGQYAYDMIYNYDSLVADFFDNRLNTGVK